MATKPFIRPSRQSIDDLIQLEVEIQREKPIVLDEYSYKEYLRATKYKSVSDAELNLDQLKAELKSLMATSDKVPELAQAINKIDSAILSYQHAMYFCCDDNCSGGRDCLTLRRISASDQLASILPKLRDY